MEHKFLTRVCICVCVGVKKGLGRSSIDGGQPSDVMEIILTGPAHWDLGA